MARRLQEHEHCGKPAPIEPVVAADRDARAADRSAACSPADTERQDLLGMEVEAVPAAAEPAGLGPVAACALIAPRRRRSAGE